MACYTTFSLEEAQKKSILYKDLIKKYKGNKEVADLVYSKIINADINTPNSFYNWLESKTEGKPELDENGEPSVMDYNEWSEWVKKTGRVHKSFVTPSITLTVEETVQLSEGITGNLIETLNKKGITFNDLFQDDTIQLNNVLNNAINETVKNIENHIVEVTDEEVTNRLQAIVSELKKEENRVNLKNTYNNYLQSAFSIKLTNISEFDKYKEEGNEENPLDDTLETNEDKNTKDTAFNKASIEFDTKDGAPKAIKLLIASLRKRDSNGNFTANALGTYELVDYNKTFNLLLDRLVNIPADIELFTEEIKELSEKTPEFKDLLKILNFGNETYIPSEETYQLLKETLLRTQFVNQFDKTRYEYVLTLIREDGTISNINANLDRAQNIRAVEWENNFKVLQAENPQDYTEEAYEELRDNEYLDFKEFLKIIGVESINPNAYENEDISALMTYGLASYESFLNIFSPGKDGVRNRILNLAKKEVQNDNTAVELQHYNAEGKLVYDISLNTYLSKMTKDFAYYAGNEQKLKELYPEIFDNPAIQHSEWVDIIRNGHNSSLNPAKIKMLIMTGLQNEITDDASDISDLNERDLIFQRIYSLFNEGISHFIRAADRSIENAISFEGSFDIYKEIKTKEAAKVTLAGYLRDELTLIDTYNQLGNTGILNLDRPVARGTRIFTLDTSINGKKDIFDFISYDKLLNMSVSDIIDSKEYNEFIDTWLNELVRKETAYINQYLEEEDVAKIKEDFGKYYENPLEEYAINIYLNNIEMSYLFTGDVALYKNPDDMIKRMSMLNSTKEGVRVDDEMNLVISSLTNNFETANGYTEPRYDSRIKTITINDIVSSMETFSQEEKDTLMEILGSLEGYENVNEADGFAFITYDERRIMEIRNGQWWDKDEALYQKISKDPDNYTITEKDYHLITPSKPQYSGKLYNENLSGLNIVAGRKFSFITLMPGMYEKGSVLEKLHNQMASKGVGMAFFSSAAKFGHTVNEDNKAHHTMYDEFGNFNIDLSQATDNMFDIIDYKFLGEQLKINKKEKYKTTQGTQKTKINLSDFFDKGVIKDSSLTPIIDDYLNLMSEKVIRSYNGLKEKLGLPTIENGAIDMELFVNSLVELGIEQSFTTNELQSIQSLIETPFIEATSNRQKLENFINSKLSNSVIKQKRTGTALAQASDVGFEINVDNNLESESHRHNLKFYRKSKDKTRLLPMEVMIPLPKKLIRYVEQYIEKTKDNPKGKGVTPQALARFNEEIARDNKIFEETGEMSDLTKITMLVGFRIPTQGAVSSEVAKVKKFLMPHIGGTIVVPKAIVAKTGSDFDIDKLNLYYPDYDVTADSDNRIARKFIKNLGENENSRKDYMIRTFNLEKSQLNYRFTDMETLSQLYIDNILKAENDTLISDIAKLSNRLYNETLQEKAQELRYVEPRQENKKEVEKQGLNNIKEGVLELFESNPELSQIGTPEQYSQYLDTIFPDSKVKDIVYHGSDVKFEEFLEDSLNYFGIKDIAKGYGKNIYPTLIDIRHPYYEDGGNLSNQSYEDLYYKLDESGSDGFISNNKNLFVPKSEEQIHIIGSKQDIEGFKEFVTQFPTTEENNLSKMTDRELSNKLLETEIALTLHPANWKPLLTPLDKNNLHDSNPENRDTISYMIKDMLKMDKTPSTTKDVFRLSFNVKKMRDFLAGKDGVGQVAVHRTNHVNAQRANLMMKDNNNFFGNVKEIDGERVIELGNELNEDGMIISELIDELMSAYVDIAKDPIVMDIHAVNETANIILMLMRQGVGLKRIYTFINQPIIKDYVKRRGSGRSVSRALDKYSQNKYPSEKEAILKALSNFGIPSSRTKDMIHNGGNNQYNPLTLEELEKSLKNRGNNSEFQLQVLDTFLALEKDSKQFQEMIRSTSPDTQSFKTFSLLENQVNLRKKVEEEGRFINYERMFDDFIGEFYKAKRDYVDKLQGIMLTQVESQKIVLDKLKEIYSLAEYSADNAEKHISRIDNDYVVWLLNVNNVINHNTDFKNLFQGKNSIPKTIHKLKQIWKKEDFEPNFFLDNMIPLINEKNIGYDNLKPKTKKMSATDKEKMYQSLYQLKEFEDFIEDVTGVSGFSDKLITFAMIQSGLNNSPYNITQFINTVDYHNFVKNTIEVFKGGRAPVADFAAIGQEEPGSFVLNNPAPLKGKSKRIGMEDIMDVAWDSKLETHVVTVSGVGKFLQKGGKGRYLDYGTIAKILPPTKNIVVPNESSEEFTKPCE